ncbi:MAG: rod shape-determining protein, partial [Clostridia bacterium]
MKDLKLVIDIGSKYTIISQVGKSVVIKEPSLVLLQNEKKSVKLVECGNGVLKYVGALTSSQQMLYPIKDGAIFQEKAAVLMYRNFIQRLLPNFNLIKPHIKALACVACGLTNVEKNEVEKVLMMAGASEVVVIEAPLAINSAIDENSSRMIVDIGASKTDVAVVSKDGIVVGCTLGVGGDSF